jgi:hypothetical protein
VLFLDFVAGQGFARLAIAAIESSPGFPVVRRALSVGLGSAQLLKGRRVFGRRGDIPQLAERVPVIYCAYTGPADPRYYGVAFRDGLRVDTP